MLRPLGRIFLLLLLAWFSLGVEEAEQERGGLPGESNRRGRINRVSFAAHHLHRAGADIDDAFSFEAASVDLPGRDLTISGAAAELLTPVSFCQTTDSRLNRGPPALSL